MTTDNTIFVSFVLVRWGEKDVSGDLFTREGCEQMARDAVARGLITSYRMVDHSDGSGQVVATRTVEEGR